MAPSPTPYPLPQGAGGPLEPLNVQTSGPVKQGNATPNEMSGETYRAARSLPRNSHARPAGRNPGPGCWNHGYVDDPVRFQTASPRRASAAPVWGSQFRCMETTSRELPKPGNPLDGIGADVFCIGYAVQTAVILGRRDGIPASLQPGHACHTLCQGQGKIAVAAVEVKQVLMAAKRRHAPDEFQNCRILSTVHLGKPSWPEGERGRQGAGSGGRHGVGKITVSAKLLQSGFAAGLQEMPLRGTSSEKRSRKKRATARWLLPI